MATQQWVTCLKEYLIEKQLPDLDLLTNEELGEIIGKFYLEARKKKVQYLPTCDSEDTEEDPNADCYKTTSLRAARGAFTRYFRDTRKIDIRTHEAFADSNEIFVGKTRDNKEKGLGKIDNKPPIEDADMKKIADYFTKIMRGPPNPKALLQIVVFNILYYLCRRGRENLRSMTKTTFGVQIDPNNGRKYIFQQEDEADKNHGPSDTAIANQGRIYERPGNTTFRSILCT